MNSVRKLLDPTSYNIDLMAVQELRWNKSESKPAESYVFSYGNGNDIYHT